MKEVVVCVACSNKVVDGVIGYIKVVGGVGVGVTNITIC